MSNPNLETERRKTLDPSTKKRSVSVPVKAYLVAYNVLSVLGWAYILGLTLTHIFNLDGTSDLIEMAHAKTATFLSSNSLESRLPSFLQPIYHRSGSTFSRIGATTAFVQTFALLEVLHVLLGLVRSPLTTTAMQVSSRLFLVWGIAEQFPEVRSHPGYTSMVLAWSATEVIRYSFYAFNLIGKNPYVLLWLRYTTFYVLYPLGAVSEAALIYAVLPSSSPVPGWASWFQGMWKPADYIRGFLFLIWWPGLYVMYTYMISQRRKTIGTSKSRTLKTA